VYFIAEEEHSVAFEGLLDYGLGVISDLDSAHEDLVLNKVVLSGFQILEYLELRLVESAMVAEKVVSIEHLKLLLIFILSDQKHLSKLKSSCISRKMNEMYLTIVPIFLGLAMLWSNKYPSNYVFYIKKYVNIHSDFVGRWLAKPKRYYLYVCWRYRGLAA
jgi:hypothetical protein